MPGLQLKTPKLNQVDKASELLKSSKMAAWAKGLPIANALESAEKLRETLIKINRIVIKPSHRFELLALFRPFCAQVYKGIKERHLGSTAPLSDKNVQATLIASALLGEMATGYKHLINELSGTGKRSSSQQQILALSLHQAMSYLSDIMVESYLIYIPEPADIWQELHQIYEYAELHQLLHIPVVGQTDQSAPAPVDINNAYKRIMLLGLASPYHLLRGEAYTVYDHMLSLSSICRISRPEEQTDIVGEYYVDLAADNGPTFASKERQSSSVNPRIIYVDKVIAAISEKIQQIMVENKRKQGGTILPLSERMKRDLYMRLKQALASRSERRFNRNTSIAEIELTVGLSSSHHFINGEEPFAPEHDEDALRSTSAVDIKAEAFSILPKENEDWHLDSQNRAQHNPNDSQRMSKFQATDPGSDVWQQVYDSQMLRMGEGGAPSYLLSKWFQRDQSIGGISLFCDIEIPKNIQVGEVLAFHNHEGGDSTDWSVGSIRWMQNIPDERIEIGIKTLAYSAMPIATRAVSGSGKGSEYFRSLLIPRGNPTETNTTLIAPAALYDVGTILLLNLKGKLLYVRLTHMLDTTRSFAHFSFELEEDGAKYESEVNDPAKATHFREAR